jgi:hypothetical protein
VLAESRLRFHPTILGACYNDDMADLHVKNLPDDIHERLREFARYKHWPISWAVITALEREVTRWEWEKDFKKAPKTPYNINVAEIMREERDRRENELRWRDTL